MGPVSPVSASRGSPPPLGQVATAAPCGIQRRTTWRTALERQAFPQLPRPRRPDQRYWVVPEPSPPPASAWAMARRAPASLASPCQPGSACRRSRSPSSTAHSRSVAPFTACSVRGHAVSWNDAAAKKLSAFKLAFVTPSSTGVVAVPARPRQSPPIGILVHLAVHQVLRQENRYRPIVSMRNDATSAARSLQY